MNTNQRFRESFVMHLTTLIENTPGGAPGLVPQHGLSLLLEVSDTRVLFDMGQDGTFIRNAGHMGLDLKKVDIGILSHGHYDHGGGLAAFLEYNNHAPVYIKAGADEAAYARNHHRYRYIGLEREILFTYAERFIRIGADTGLSPGLLIITEIRKPDPLPRGNRTLLIRGQETFRPDPFLHELFLVVEEEDGISIITGCAHSGILNMLYTARDRYPGQPIKAVVGGFHLTDRDTLPEEVRSIGKTLKSAGCGRVITGHCTGTRARDILHEELGSRFAALCTGYSTEI